MTPPEYDVANVPHGGGYSHGGIAVLYQQGFNVVSRSDNTDRHFTSFEYCFIVFSCGSKCFTVVTRPYPSAKNQLTTGMLLNEFSQFMQDLTIAKGGRLSNSGRPESPSGYSQWPWYSKIWWTYDHSRSWAICYWTNPPMWSYSWCCNNTHVLDLISDHALLACSLRVRKPPVPRTIITSRKYRSIDCANLNEEVLSSELTISVAILPMLFLISTIRYFRTYLTNMHHLRPKLLSHAFSSPGLVTLYIKLNVSVAERKWISSGLTVDYEHFKELKNKYKNALYSAKCDFYNRKILDCGNDFKSMFDVISTILHDPPSFLITALHLNWQIVLQRILLLRYRLVDWLLLRLLLNL